MFAACGLVPDRPLLVAAVQRWDPVSAVKTKEDAVTAAALTLAAHQAQGVGFGAEAACAVAIHGYRDYLPVARQADRLLRERPEVAQHLADALCHLAPKLAVPEGGA